MKKTKQDKHIVSVVIPTIGRNTIELTKKALKNQSRKADEIIVILDKEKKGASWARNRGFEKSKGDLIAFIDDDCIPEKDWLKKLIKAIDKYKAGGAGGTYTETDSFLQEIRKRKNYPKKEQIDNEGKVGAGGNVIYKRSWLEKCKKEQGYLFDEKVKISEDFELAGRIRQKGATFVFVPSNPKHLKKLNFIGYLKLQFGRGIGIANLYKSYKNKKITPYQKSLIWDKDRGVSGTNWILVFLKKLFGPFDISSFSSFRNFFLFWLGEKAQGIGFIYGITTR